jgi:hypothetical protein
MEKSKEFTPRMMRDAISHPEVEEAMKTLSKYGLGVWLPHMHSSDDGHLVSLPDDMVAIEVEGENPDKRTVTFVKRNRFPLEDLKQTAVAWIWNSDKDAAVVATSCTDEKTRHG